MNNNKYSIPTILLFFALLVFSACSKDKDNIDLSRNAGMTMKLDGKEWQATMTTLLTEEHETSQLGNFYTVYLNGTKIIEKNSNTEDDLVETLGLYINIPASKFRNPKGTYPIILEESKIEHAWGIFVGRDDHATTYVSGDPNNENQVVGKLEITDFEIGNQSVFGYISEDESYTKLSGKFQLNVYPLKGTGSKLEITEGKFDLSGFMNFGL
jgi:hypothetical protein